MLLETRFGGRGVHTEDGKGDFVLRIPGEMQSRFATVLRRKACGTYFMCCKCVQVFGVHRHMRICLSANLARHC